MYDQAQVALHFGQWRKLTFNKIGCQKYDAPTQSTLQMCQTLCHKKSPESCSDIYNRDDTAGVIRLKYNDLITSLSMVKHLNGSSFQRVLNNP